MRVLALTQSNKQKLHTCSTLASLNNTTICSSHQVATTSDREQGLQLHMITSKYAKHKLCKS